MAITVYTYNDKVLKNVATNKWLKKPDAPAGFVMNGSNASIGTAGNAVMVSWHGPSYPNCYDGGNKQCTIVNNNDAGITVGVPVSTMMYGDTATGGGPNANSSVTDLGPGTRTITLLSNPVPSTYGAYILIPFNGTVEQVSSYIGNLTITILDP